MQAKKRMTRELFGKDVDKKIAQFHRIFDRDSDLLSAVLRGHMTVEEQMHDLIAAGVAQYSRPYSRNDIFTFGTATELCRAIVGSAMGPELWDSIKALNNLRNAVGHRNEPARLKPLLAKFFKVSEPIGFAVYQKNFAPYEPEGEDEETHAIVIRTRSMAIWTILGILADQLARELDPVLKDRRNPLKA
ncbi:hypothetical protein [Pseudomonas sp. zjy_11]|uniref:hypothetical protein n=1 Tax=Pseudomonas sp. zjy_11 TaxID=3367262 RepID=UPI00370C8AC7